MDLQAEIREIKRTQARIDSKLTVLLNKAPKETWVRVSFITDLTGWEGEKMRQAREQGIIKYKRAQSGGFIYLLESLPEQFIIKKTA